MRKERKNLRKNSKMLEKKQETTNKGITLIALVVTIVVLLILASVSITVVFGDNGILQLAKEAGEKTNEAVQNDKENIGNMTNYIKSLSWDASKVTAVATKDGGIVPVPKGFVASGATGENIVSEGFVIYEGTDAVTDANVANAREERNQFVWVPVDGESLKYEQDKTSWSSKTYYYAESNPGWTDVESEAEQNIVKRIESVEKYGGFYVGRYEAGVPESKDYTESTKYTDKANATNRNKSNVETKDLPAMKKGLQSWNYVSQTNAKELSRKMYENSTSVTSRLIDSYAWDTICHWFSSSSINVTDSTKWGNYINAESGSNVNGLYSKHKENYLSSVWQFIVNSNNYGMGLVTFEARSQSDEQDVYELATGISERNKANNIYDFAGNMWEWTTETEEHTADHNSTGYNKNNGTYAVLRGGGCDSDGSDNSASHRNGDRSVIYCDVNISFRPVLYIK